MEYFYIKKYLQMQSHIAEIIEKIEIFFHFGLIINFTKMIRFLLNTMIQIKLALLLTLKNVCHQAADELPFQTMGNRKCKVDGREAIPWKQFTSVDFAFRVKLTFRPRFRPWNNRQKKKRMKVVHYRIKNIQFDRLNYFAGFWFDYVSMFC